MAQETLKIGPPRYIVAIVGALTPRAFRTALLVRLAADYKTVPGYIAGGIAGIRKTTIVQAVEAFNPWRLVGDLCCLYIAFCTAPALPLTIILAVAVTVLIWRDAYTDPPESSGAEAVTDAIVLGIFIVASQTVLMLALPSMMMSAGLGIGLSIGMAMVSGWRFAFRMKDPPRGPVLDAYRSVWRTNVLWMIGFAGLCIANTWIVAATWVGRDFLYVFTPLFFFFLDYRMQSNAIGAMVRKDEPLSIRTDPNEQELGAKQNSLLRGQPKTGPELPASKWFEPLFQIVLALPICSAVVSVLVGRIPPENVDWMQLAANTAALVTLSILWIEVKKINAQVALAIQKEIDDLRKGSGT